MIEALPLSEFLVASRGMPHAVLSRAPSALEGWSFPAAGFAQPREVLRYQDGTLVITLRGEKTLLCRTDEPLRVLEQRLRALAPAPSSPDVQSSSFILQPSTLLGGIRAPVAIIAAAYEFGAWFDPHQQGFHEPRWLEFFAAIYDEVHPIAIEHGKQSAGNPELFALVPAMDRERYRRQVRHLQEHMRAGDIYQANLTVPWIGHGAPPATEVFARALQRGGAAFGGYLFDGEREHVSMSPELFLRRRGNVVETHPIKGTRRIAEGADVHALSDELLASEKDFAEHLMIVDLERNDLGRLCKPGTVDVDPLMTVVQHPTVLHLESRVRGTLFGGVDWQDLFQAAFPGGSVTGAPKKRALELIKVAEIGPRGLYCGAFGWIGADGDGELNLPIRTATFAGEDVLIGAGGGIVLDSDPDAEWEEMETKLAFLRGCL